MSEDAHLSDSLVPYDPRKFEWNCPYPNCKYYFKGFGQSSLDAMRELHLGNHKRDQFMQEKGITPSSPMAREENPTVEDLADWAKRIGKTIVEKSPEEYEKLDLTVTDKAFLKTRGISIDEWEERTPSVAENDKAFLKSIGVKDEND